MQLMSNPFMNRTIVNISSIFLILISIILLYLAYVNFFKIDAPGNYTPSTDMNAFLRQSRKLLALKDPLVVVLGNESCDLDSAVSAISLAFYYAQTDRTGAEFALSADERHRVLPMLNIAREYLPTKTEVTYFLKQHHIDLENVVCRDDMPDSLFESSKYILVDHHVSPLKSSVVQVIDHRPLDPEAALPSNCSVTINQMGSCTTLIADLILRENSIDTQKEVLDFLYPVIVLDTVNFSPVADKARPLDVSVSERIASAFNISAQDNLRMFDDMVTARADVSTLDSLQILSKDMKRVVSKQTGRAVVAIPGFPISVSEYVQMPLAASNLKVFARNHNCSIVLLMGMKVVDQLPQRDLAVVQMDERYPRVYTQILNDLTASGDLELVEVQGIDFLSGRFYRQNNVKGSRKQVLPLVQNIVDALVHDE